MNEQNQEGHPAPSSSGVGGNVQPRVVVGDFGTQGEPADWQASAQQPAQPDSQTEPYIGLTGSSMQFQKQPLPKGVYVVVGLIALGVILSFFDTSQLSWVYTLNLVVSLLLGAGLLMRLEVARKLLAVLAAILVAALSLTLVLLFGYQQRVNDAVAQYETAVSNIDEQTLTPAEQAQLATLQTEVDKAKERVGSAITFSYIINGAYILLYGAMLVYLTRPKVKQVFEKMKT